MLPGTYVPVWQNPRRIQPLKALDHSNRFFFFLLESLLCCLFLSCFAFVCFHHCTPSKADCQPILNSAAEREPIRQMRGADCTEYSGYNLDIYVFLVCFVLILLASFSCCCLNSNRPKRIESERELHKEENSGGSCLTFRLFCGDELLCRGKENSCSHQAVLDRPWLGASVFFRVLIALVGGLCAAWALLAIIFAGIKTSTMFPAETIDDCTPCSGSIETITFRNVDEVANDRSPYCCDYNPTDYLNVRAVSPRPNKIMNTSLASRDSPLVFPLILGVPNWLHSYASWRLHQLVVYSRK